MLRSSTTISPLSSPLRRRSPRLESRRVEAARRSRRAPTQVAAAREIARLRRHFREVLAELRGRDVAHLSAAQRASRAQLLGELERYARRGRFPRNVHFPQAKTPYFVDVFGTRCAMAHLIESTGAADLVARVARTSNNALVREIEGDLELRAWLEQAGLTAAEAGRIQPSYCFITKAEQCVCNGGAPVEAVVELTVTGTSATQSGYVTGRVDAVYGAMSLVAEGDAIEVFSSAGAGASLLVGVSDGGANLGYSPIFERNGDLVDPGCALDIPALDTATAVEALLSSDCAATLTAKDPIWGESQCEDDEGGCSIPAVGAPTSALPGVLVLAATILAQRRWRARGRVRARRAR